MSVNARMKPARILAATKTRDDLGATVETWSDIGGATAAAHPLSANQVAQMGVKYGETTHMLLTPLRGLVVGMSRIEQGGVTYEPTFVNEAGRLSQVYARVVS